VPPCHGDVLSLVPIGEDDIARHADLFTLPEEGATARSRRSEQELNPFDGRAIGWQGAEGHLDCGFTSECRVAEVRIGVAFRLGIRLTTTDEDRQQRSDNQRPHRSRLPQVDVVGGEGLEPPTSSV
jgi:hypothetical protein